MLQDYVRNRILEFVSEHAFAKKLYASPDMARAAAEETLEELGRPNSDSSREARNLKLVFRHSCL